MDPDPGGLKACGSGSTPLDSTINDSTLKNSVFNDPMLRDSTLNMCTACYRGGPGAAEGGPEPAEQEGGAGGGPATPAKKSPGQARHRPAPAP
jgi:hypothetical protein